MKTIGVLLSLSVVTVTACVTTDLSSQAQEVGCDDGVESYVDENGEEVICVHTEEPFDPDPGADPGDPGEPWDWCSSFPEMCLGDDPEPPPPDPTDPGGEPEAACWFATTYQGHGSYPVWETPTRTLAEAYTMARNDAKLEAIKDAEKNCTTSFTPFPYCTGHPTMTGVGGTGCVEEGEAPSRHVTCYATASAACNYRY